MSPLCRSVRIALTGSMALRSCAGAGVPSRGSLSALPQLDEPVSGTALTIDQMQPGRAEWFSRVDVGAEVVDE